MEDLISEDAYDDLPDDPELKFVTLERLARSGMNNLISHDTSPDFDQLIRLEYMAVVAAAAEELDIEGVYFPTNYEHSAIEGFEEFSLRVSRATTRIKLRNRNNKKLSVRLSPRTKARIELQIRKLREIIENSDLPQKRKDDLLKKVDALYEEVQGPRVSMAHVMVALAFIGAGLGGATSFLADAPEALATITGLIGQDKIAEEAEPERLGSPTKALPAPNRQEPVFAPFKASDDDIPF